MIYAEDLNYWQTSRSSADEWIDKAKKLIQGIKGQILQEAFGESTGRAAYLLVFRINDDDFRIV